MRSHLRPTNPSANRVIEYVIYEEVMEDQSSRDSSRINDSASSIHKYERLAETISQVCAASQAWFLPLADTLLFEQPIPKSAAS